MSQSPRLRFRLAAALFALVAVGAVLFMVSRDRAAAPAVSAFGTPVSLPATPQPTTRSERVKAALAAGPAASADPKRAASRAAKQAVRDVASVSTTAGKPRYRKRQVLVRFKADASAAERAAARASVSGTVGWTLDDLQIERLDLKKGLSVAEAIDRLSGNAGVDYAQPNGYRYLTTTPNDPEYPRLWGLHNTGTQYSGSETDADIDYPEAWDSQANGAPVTVAVIDTGVQLDHPDLASKLWTNPNEVADGDDDDDNEYIDDLHGVNVVNDSGDPSPIADHGTHVAGTIAAASGNGVGVSGVSRHAKLMSIQAFKPVGGTFRADDTDLLDAVQYALDNGADVINASYAGYVPYQLMQDLLQSSDAAGTTFVAAAGNDAVDTDTQPTFPCSIPSPNVICVGASTPADTLASFSNFGEANVDLLAPGVAVYSTITGSSYGYGDGTSMAAPHVAGAAAALQGANPTWTPAQIKTRLLGTVDPVAALHTSVTNGRLNLAQALSGSVPTSTAAATVGVSAGKVTYAASAGAVNAVEILKAPSATAYTVEDPNAILTASGACSSVTTHKVTCPSTGVTGATANLNDRSDYISAPVDIPVTVNAGAGNDSIKTGPAADTVNGDAGDDQIDAGEGNDTIDGGDGNDWTPGTANGGDDVIHGGVGDDSLNGGAGVDQIFGDDGKDIINPGHHTSGVEIGNGGAGDDWIWAGKGDDQFVGGSGHDHLDYGFHGSAPVAVTIGASGNGSTGENDVISADIEELSGGTGDDVVTGDGNANVLAGSNGNDIVRGMAGDDIIREDGGDFVDGALEWFDDDFSGGDGNDRLVYYRPKGVDDDGSGDMWSANLSLDGVANDGYAPAEQDFIRSDIEGAEGGDADDIITGNAGPNTLGGGIGNDVLTGGGGTDVYEGSRIIYGPCPVDGAWCKDGKNDTVSYADKTVGVTASLDGAANDGNSGEAENIPSTVEKIVGSPQADTLSSSAALPSILDGGLGVDQYAGGAGDQTFLVRDAATETVSDCGGGTDTVRADASDTAPAASCETVDKQAAARITSGVSEHQATGDSTPTFTFDAPYSSGITFKCKVEAGKMPGAGALAPCGSPWTPSPLADGDQVLSVQAFDGPQQSGPAATRTFVVDTDLPETAFAAEPETSPTSTTAKFTMSHTGGNGTFECKIDDGAFSRCGDIKAYSNLPLGTHTFSGRARDRAGNVDPTPVTHSWTIDLGLETTITGGPASGSNVENPSQTFTFTGSLPGTFQCKVDGGAWTACTSPYTRTYSTSTHVFSVRLVDAAGNIEPTPASRLFTVVPQSFSTVITSGPPTAQWTNDDTPTFTFGPTPAGGGYWYDCQVGINGTWQDCTSPYTTYPISQQGATQFRVRAVSMATGVPDYTPASQTVYLDTVAPDTTISSGPAAGSTISTATPTFQFGDPDFTTPANCQPGTLSACSTFERRVDGGAWTATANPWTTPALSDGAHTVEFRSIDPAGNVDATPVSRTFTVQTGPTLSLSAPQTLSSSTDLTGSPAALDWVHWRNAVSTNLDRRSVSPTRLSSWTKYGSGAVTVPTSPSTTFTWSDATGTAAGSSAAGVSTGAANGRGFWFTSTAALTETRTLRVYVGVKGGTSASTTGQLAASFTGGTVVPAVSATVTAPAGTTVDRAFDVTFRPGQTTDSLKIDWTQTVGGTSSGTAVVLYGATLR